MTAITRRRFLGATAGAAGLALATACGSVTPKTATPQTTGGGKLTLTMFAFLGGDLGKMPKEFAKEYMATHKNVDIKIYEQSNSVGYTKMLAQKKAAPDQPLVNFGFFNAQTSIQGADDKMFTPLDYSAMSNAADIDERFRYDDSIGIGIGVDQLGLLYNKDKLPEAPDTWAALWDHAHQGQISFFSFPWYAVYMAAKLNGGDLTNLEPGWELWKREAKQIRLLVESNPQYLNVLSNGTAPLTAYFAGTGQQWINSGAPLAYAVPKEGAIPLPVNLQAVEGQSSSHLEAIHDIINEMLSPKWCARWAETSVEVPANTKAPLPQNLTGLPAFSKATTDGFQQIDYTIIGRNNAEWQKRWETDIASRI
ncbi:extracellular solute-binding protein [Nonomuraea sp. MG754425]|uniref:ABC transporter substrate-binding protein n=1 Tax=Nonomuraea sp. MG754425 TaxID=2570319 RepID=UPI0023518DE6|nr:extracellular solute-binding protein [Nonomuraea sp. MG754425]MCF6476696.1 extracellular solute-binding protein [Nonomuraea sp. MG754425]